MAIEDKMPDAPAGGERVFETREVLAGAYVGGANAKPEAMLSHAVEVVDGQEARVLCRRVKLDSLADRYASDPSIPPSCIYCRAALKERPAPEPPCLPGEEWRPVVGAEGYYEVSDFGRVRVTRVRRRYTEEVLAEPRILIGGRRRGYRNVRVGSRCERVHTLVLQTFKGPKPPGYGAAHLDGNRLNNRADNLAWVTRKENAAHKELHGTSQSGERRAAPKLTPADRAAIRVAHGERGSTARLAKAYGVSEETIRRAVKRGG